MAPPPLSRLYQDLAELYDSPYPGVTVFTNDANIRQFCLVLAPPSGPWKGLSLHFDVVLPENWPISPPQVSSSVDGINHPNLFGDYICCDLLKEYNAGGGYSGGYTPALTLRGLFLQFLTFFSSSRVEQEYGGYIEIGESVTVRYAREADLAGNRARSNRLQDSSSSDANQDALRREWDRDRHAVVVIERSATEIGPLLETAKSSRPDLRRLHRIEEINYRWTSTFKAIRYWQCKHCPYGTDAVPHCAGTAPRDAMDVDDSSPLLIPPAVCRLGLVNDDVLLTMASHLPSESLITFSVAYPRLHDLVQAMHVLLQRELRCFFLRTNISESVLGIGISFDFRSRALSSDFDWLSQRAFDDYGIRKSVEKREFSFFLPLAFSRPHFERVYPTIWIRLEEIDKEVQRAEQRMSRNPRQRAAGPPMRQDLVVVIYKMMSNIVVSLMKNCDDALGSTGNSKTLLHASEKAVVAYCHLFHLLISLCRTDPQIVSDATNRLRRFIDHKGSRDKTHVPDLGELIVLIMLVVCRPPVGNDPPIQWASLAGPFLEEVLIRNVRWVLKDAPHLEVMERGPSDYRLAETFSKSKTSLRLVMFQITFLDFFFKAYGADVSPLDNNYGFPEKELPERMVEAVKEIFSINTWPAFFDKARYPHGVALGKERFSDMLRDAVKTSASRRYHNAAPFNRLSALQGQRKRVEAESMRR
ncbi:hypothetical protein DFH06DRAFT_1156235 [Mycena polygramma]|nr:hypothetical protein DFH06DRAFT_1156235 [Mycena polygramma]